MLINGAQTEYCSCSTHTLKMKTMETLKKFVFHVSRRDLLAVLFSLP
jgi:hypothetical protein